MRRYLGAYAAWRNTARPDQLPPSDLEWLVWLLLTGRGTGKTRTGAETAARWAIEHPGVRIALVAATFDDARDTMVEGESGLQSVLDRYGVTYRWNRSLGQLVLGNGSRFDVYSAEKPRQLRGPQHHYAWCDELAWWMHPRATWDNLLFGLRLGRRQGIANRVIVTTTPRPIKLLRELVADGDVRISRASTFDNAKHLPERILRKLREQYDGTTVGQQELYGVLLDELEGAAWTRALVEAAHAPVKPPEFDRLVVSVDPAVKGPRKRDDDPLGDDDGKSTHDPNKTGIVVAGRDARAERRPPHLYVVHSEQAIWTPNDAMRRAVELAVLWDADAVVIEENNGGDYLPAMLHVEAERLGVKVHHRLVNATKLGGKLTRAEHAVGLYQQNRAHHIGQHEELEDQQVSFTGDPRDPSPDLMDALVWAAHDLIPPVVRRRTRAGRRRGAKLVA